MRIRELFSGRIFTFSNFLSISRILLVPFIGIAFSLEQSTGDSVHTWQAIALLALLVATDFFDGLLARALDQVSRLGQFIDPLADKIAAFSLSILLYYYKHLPLWVIIVIVARDCLTVLGGIVMFSHKDIQVRPNIFGKLMVASMGIAALVYILSPTIRIAGITLQQMVIAPVLIFLVISSFVYWRTYSRIYFDKER